MRGCLSQNALQGGQEQGDQPDSIPSWLCVLDIEADLFDLAK